MDPDTSAMFPACPFILNKRLCVRLFATPGGSYLVAAAAKGQNSASTKREGGFFTTSLFREIEENLGNSDLVNHNLSPGWTTIIQNSSKAAEDIGAKHTCDNMKCLQTAIFRMDK